GGWRASWPGVRGETGLELSVVEVALLLGLNPLQRVWSAPGLPARLLPGLFSLLEGLTHLLKLFGILQGLLELLHGPLVRLPGLWSLPRVQVVAFIIPAFVIPSTALRLSVFR